MTADRLRTGYVIVLPGIDGANWLDRSVVRGLLQADIPFAIEVIDWTRGPFFLLNNLRSRKRHTEQTSRIVARIEAYHEEYPHRPVHLIGHSGGGGMALYTLAALPKPLVSNAILLGAAVSRRYDLAAPLRNVTGKIYNFHSWGDWFVIGLFTTLAGTIDRRHRPGIGFLGTRRRPLRPEDAERVIDIPYRLEFWKTRNFAGHFGYTASPFVKRWLAPLLHSTPSPDAEILKSHR
ncbi:alpha/beta fold hydrolase [Planctomicrobium sp. SH664]|uniref:alpha/beta fold hydrolase n=1 Tax=Planctomicrobium sp. SH664 TaxID=3448125 RepID=UPI003F5AE9C1